MHGYTVRPTVSVTGIMSPSHGFRYRYHITVSRFQVPVSYHRLTVSGTGIMSPSHGFRYRYHITVSRFQVPVSYHRLTVSGTGIISPSHGFRYQYHVTVSRFQVPVSCHRLTVSGTGIISPSHGFTAKSHGKQNSLNPLIHWSQSLVKHNFLHFRFALVMVLDQYLWISSPATSTSIFQSFWNSKHRFCYAYSGCLKSYNDENIYLGVDSIKLF